MKKQIMSIIAVAGLLAASSATLAYNNFRMPPGNYPQTCHSCSVHNGVLRCNCDNRSGFSVFSQQFIPNRCNFVQNFNGHLKCTHYRHKHHYPGYNHFKRNFSAGPIWNQGDANNKCPVVCRSHYAHWTGQWHTVRAASNSVCQCEKK